MLLFESSNARLKAWSVSSSILTFFGFLTFPSSASSLRTITAEFGLGAERSGASVPAPWLPDFWIFRAEPAASDWLDGPPCTLYRTLILLLLALPIFPLF